MTQPSKYAFTATDATRESILLRAGFCGTTGSGKTYTSLLVAARIADKLSTGPVFVIDTEHKSALRYAYSPRSKQGFRFKHVPMPENDCGPAAYLAALDFCEGQGAGVIVIDSLSHMWAGIGGVLEQVDQVASDSRSKDTFGAGWRKMTPIHTRAIERIMQSSAHLIFTLRSKADYVIVENDRGRKEPKKVGMAPIAREGIDYEPDMFFVCEAAGRDTVLWVDKSRALDRPSLSRGAHHTNPGDAFAEDVIGWLTDGEPRDVEADLLKETDRAIAEGVAASQARDADRYGRARSVLVQWCRANGVKAEREAQAVATMKERVGAAAANDAAKGAA